MSITKKRKKKSLVQRLTFDVHSFMPVEKNLKNQILRWIIFQEQTDIHIQYLPLSLSLFYQLC